MNLALQTAKKAFKQIEHISIDQIKLQEFAQAIINTHTDGEVDFLADSPDLESALMLSFVFNSMNFCYWALPGQLKWKIVQNGAELDGSLAFFKALEHESKVNSQFLNPKYLSCIPYAELERICAGNIQIPLLKDRHENLQNLGQILVDKYEGRAENILKQSENCARRILDRLSEEFNCFDDQSIFQGETVYFWKRAQLQIKTIHDHLVAVGHKGLRNMHILTAFADYKVPQLLRHLGIIEYDAALAALVDNYELIAKDSEWENEIRIATIVAIDMISQATKELGKELTSSEVDNLLWSRASSNKDEMKPYHRTLTSAY